MCLLFGSRHPARIAERRNLAGLEELLETAQIFANRLRRLATEKRGQKGAGPAGRRRVLKLYRHCVLLPSRTLRS